MRRTKTQAEQTREAIIAAAITVFLERGFARATFDEVARTAGVTRGAVHWHFPDKKEIFHALERRADLPNAAFSRRLEERLAPARAPDVDPLDELARAIREAVRTYEANGERRRILAILRLRCEYVGEMLPALERQQEADAALEQLLVDVFGVAAAQGGLLPGWSPAMAGRVLFLLVRGSFEYWLRAPAEARLETTIMPLVTAFLRLVQAPGRRGDQ